MSTHLQTRAFIRAALATGRRIDQIWDMLGDDERGHVADMFKSRPTPIVERAVMYRMIAENANFYCEGFGNTNAFQHKISAIKRVREIIPNLGLKEAKDFVEGVPMLVNPEHVRALRKVFGHMALAVGDNKPATMGDILNRVKSSY